MDNPVFVRDEAEKRKSLVDSSLLPKNNFEKNPVPVAVSSNNLDEKGKVWPQYLAALGANLGAASFGAVMCWSSTAIPSLQGDEDFGSQIGDVQISWISSIVTLGALAVSFPSGFLADHFGRRKTMLCVCPLFVGGWILLFFSQNMAMILSGRFITGLSIGTFALAAPIFIAETSQPSIRGMLVSAFDTMACAGVLFQQIVGTYVSWRYQALICMTLPMSVFLILLFVPESPRYLLSKGLEKDALKSLAWLRQVSPNSQLVINEIKELSQNIARTNEGLTNGESRFKELWRPAVRRSLFIGFMLFFLQIASGMMATILYRVEIFQSAESGMDEYLSSVIVAIVDVLSSVVAVLVIDRFGRKFLLVISEFITALSLAGLGTFFHVKRTNHDFAMDHLAWLPLAALIVFVAGYSIGLGCIPYSIVPEMLPQRIRGLGSSLLTTSRWSMAFLATRFFKDLMNGLGEDGGYWLFSACSVFGIFFVFVFVPETKGKSLEVIQDDLNNRQHDTNSSTTQQNI